MSIRYILILTTIITLLATTPAQAEITWSGDFYPTPPTDWTTSSWGSIGRDGNGTLLINDGSSIHNSVSAIGHNIGSTGEVTVDGSSSEWISDKWIAIGEYGSGTLNITDGGKVENGVGFIGFLRGSTGEVTVDGEGSNWYNQEELRLGDLGNGVLNIKNGGTVSVSQDTFLAVNTDSSGIINFDNGTLETGGLLCGLDDLTGTGIINTHGLISDVDLVFDSEHDYNQTLVFNENANQNITLNLNVNGQGSMGAGYRGLGTMNVSDGRHVTSTLGLIGIKEGSIGQVTIDGSGSKWTNSQDVFIGYFGNGKLNLTNGAILTNQGGHIGRTEGSVGEVTVDGIGSYWCNTGELYVGDFGYGKLNITNGGLVSNENNSNNWNHAYISYSYNSTGVVNVDGVGSKWTNSGIVNVGLSGNGTLNITGGGEVSNTNGYIGIGQYSNGSVRVAGEGSTWSNIYGTTVGSYGTGKLSIEDGGTVTSSTSCYVGHWEGSTGEVTVDGPGSSFTVPNLRIGVKGSGTLKITNGGTVSSERGGIGSTTGSFGLVTVTGPGSIWSVNNLGLWSDGSGILEIANGGMVKATNLSINYDYIGDGSFNMSTGGMLALFGEADDSLADFLDLITGTDKINFWDDSLLEWADITSATMGIDYSLSYMTDGDLAGYTVLTVPEPATITMVAICGLAMIRRRNR